MDTHKKGIILHHFKLLKIKYMEDGPRTHLFRNAFLNNRQ